MANLMKLEEQLSPASRGYPTSCGQEGDEDTTSVASDRSDETFDMAKGNLSLLEKAIALESERAKVMRDRMASEHAFPRRDHHHHHHHRGHGEHSPRLNNVGEERKSRAHHEGMKRAYYPKGTQPPHGPPSVFMVCWFSLADDVCPPRRSPAGLSPRFVRP